MAFNLQSVLKALLFSSGQPLSLNDFQSVITRFREQHAAPEAPAAEPGTESAAPAEEVVEEDARDEIGADDVPELITTAQLREALEAIEQQLRESDDVYLLMEGAQGYRIVCNPRYAKWVRALRNEPPPAKLSQSALETLAVVSYRQPVTRSEIEAVRGVSADAGLNKLLERELIYVTGRAELPGRPLQYGTTEKFLEFVGVKSLVELPASDVLSPRQIDEWLKDAMNPTTPGDVEMGLPLEEGEGDTPMEDDAHIEISATDAAASEAPEEAPAEGVEATPESAVDAEPETEAATAAPDEETDSPKPSSA